MNRIKKADERKRHKNKGEIDDAQNCDFHSGLFRNGTAIPAMTHVTNSPTRLSDCPSIVF